MSKLNIIVLILLITVSSVTAQKGSKERVKVYSLAIEGNLIGDSPERDVTVYLPPSYNYESDRQYPVVYMLHGFTDNDHQWFGWEDHWINLHEVIDQSLEDGSAKEMIVVMPNAYNTFKGSMYSSSPTIGDWETFITQELVNYIDYNYRTLPQKESRGLAGHSMGGYGTIRIGMKYSDVFSSIYLLSACCMEGGVTTNVDFMHSLESITTIEQLPNAGFGQMANLASAAAWSPNPNKAPLYLDLPFENDEVRQDIASKLAANRILYIIEQYIPNLRNLKAIAMDAGLQDQGISNSTVKLHELLNSYDIAHTYESYEGNHINKISDRILTRTLPFFSKNLNFGE